MAVFEIYDVREVYVVSEDTAKEPVEDETDHVAKDSVDKKAADHVWCLLGMVLANCKNSIFLLFFLPIGLINYRTQKADKLEFSAFNLLFAYQYVSKNKLLDLVRLKGSLYV